MVVFGGQPEIFRAAQRDEIFQKHICDEISDIVLSVFGIRRWITLRDIINLGSKFVYQGLTTLSKLQTLGEEYTGIVHWTEAGQLPSTETELFFIFLNCFGEKFVEYLLTQFKVYLNNLPEDTPLRPEAKSLFIQSADNIRKALPLLLRLHKAIFYIEGRYYHISKRLTGIRYALVRFWLKDRSLVSTFRLLGAITIFQQLGMAIYEFRKNKQIHSADNSQAVSSSQYTLDQCSLCMNGLSNTSSTPCGHLFCWTCIITWLMEHHFCPLCREDVNPSRVVLLRN